MTKKEKIEKLVSADYSLWRKTRERIAVAMSDKQTMFCMCGQLATGFHEGRCKKFSDKVDSMTVKELWKTGREKVTA